AAGGERAERLDRVRICVAIIVDKTRRDADLVAAGAGGKLAAGADVVGPGGRSRVDQAIVGRAIEARTAAQKAAGAAEQIEVKVLPRPVARGAALHVKYIGRAGGQRDGEDVGIVAGLDRAGLRSAGNERAQRGGGVGVGVAIIVQFRLRSSACRGIVAVV